MASLRVEFSQNDHSLRFGGTTLAITATATAGGSRPTVPGQPGTGEMFARFTSDVAVYVDVGSNPNPAGDAALLVLPGMPVDMEVSAGQLISAVLASDIVSGVSSTARLPSAAGTNNATVVKATPGAIYGIQGYNAANAVRYLKLYNKATAPTIGTDTPVRTLALPPAAAFAFDFPRGYHFTIGIGFGLVTGAGDSDNTAVTAADILGLNIDYN